MRYHLKPPHSHIFTNFAISLFTLCILSLISILLLVSMCGGLGYIHTWFSLFLFHIIRPCVSVHFLGPLLLFIISYSHCPLSVFIHILFWPQFPIFTPSFSCCHSSSVLYHDGLCHIVLGVSSFLCRFHVHMVIVGVSDVAELIFLLYIHCLVVVFLSPLTSFHLYSCSLHSYLRRDLQFGNAILGHQHIPILY